MFLRHLLPAAIMGGLTLGALAQGSASPEQLYRALNAAMLKRDTAAIAQLTTADFTLTHITGYRQTRREWLQHIDSGKMRYLNIQEHSVQGSATESGARVIGRSLVTADIWGAHGTWPLQLDYELVQENRRLRGGWKARRAVATLY